VEVKFLIAHLYSSFSVHFIISHWGIFIPKIANFKDFGAIRPHFYTDVKFGMWEWS